MTVKNFIINSGLATTGIQGAGIMPSLNLDFVNSETLDPRITFTRNSSATRTNDRGFIETVGTNTPRFDYDPITGACNGLLIEDSRTNFFANTLVSGGGVVGTGTVLGPDNNNCRAFTPTAGDRSFPGVGVVSQSFSATLGQTVDYTWSGYFAVGATGTPVLEPLIVMAFAVAGPTSVIYATLQINTTTWTVRNKGLGTGITEIAAPVITLVSTELYRVTWTVRYTQDATARNAVWAQIQTRTTAGSGTFTADGVSGIQYALCQAEAGAFATTVIPTTTTAATRAVESAVMTGTNFSSWYNQSSGTFTCLAARTLTSTGVVNFPGIFYVDDGTLNNCIGILFNDAGNYIGVEAYVAGVYQWGMNTLSSPVGGTYYNTSVGYSLNNYAAVTNNGTLQPVTSGGIPTVNMLRLGSLRGGNARLNGCIKHFAFYPTRLTNAELTILSQQ